MKKALVCGAGGFIGHHLVRFLKKEGFWVRGVDLKYPEFSPRDEADDFVIGDLREIDTWSKILDTDFDEIYQLAADMGGAGFVFTGDNDADIMHNSALINLNCLYALAKRNFKGKVFYSSSACVYPEYRQTDPNNPGLKEEDAYPAAPDSEYGWEKLFSERMYLAFHRNYGINVRIARFHNIFGQEGTYEGGREKAPANICRQVAMVIDGGTIQLQGDGEQTRSFLYIDDCLVGVRKLMNSNYTYPINIGSDRIISINELARLIIKISNKQNIQIEHVGSKQLGVRGRNADLKLAKEVLGWYPTVSLEEGMRNLYQWVYEQLKTKGLVDKLQKTEIGFRAK
ncbi:MAG: NAD-dependent epimerase/dehydratase family protein [Patescibacteria group bacterium]|nr:NAD-dependent epimerase/dehydratase family protein [Patescibacteria group bacterium]